jgi:hypothetical protein
MGALLFLSPWATVSDFASCKGGSLLSQRKTPFMHDAIGTGPLALRPSHAHGWVARLADELSLIAYNSRPGVSSKEAKILLGFKHSKEQVSISNATPFYLKESLEGKGLCVCQEPAVFWVKPILLDSGSVLLEVVRRVVTGEGQEVEEKGQFIANLQGGASRYNPGQQEYALEFRGGSAFPYDVLMQKYGGQEFAPLGNQVILELPSRRGSYALFVTAGNYLQYVDGEWQITALEELQADLPVALVRLASERGIEVDLWEKSGFYPFPVKIEGKKGGAVPFPPESMPSGIRLRTGTQVSCAFGKRRLILKQGDWVIKGASGWRHLRNAEDIQLYLQRRLKGDLFIFDGIEKEAQGKLTMKGHLFDETHTYVQPVSLPINVDKQQSKTTRKRRSTVRGVK